MSLSSTPRTSPSQGGGSCVPSSAEAKATPNKEEELDALHKGVTSIFGARLTFAELGNPKKILEVGAGSGAWAIHAANEYPDAEVTAIDVLPLPKRVLPKPKNLKFIIGDIFHSLPFDNESFDIVHARFVLAHLPNFKDVLTRICALLKPGGQLICEEFETRAYSAHGGTPKAVEFFHDRISEWAASRGESYDVGRELLPYVSGLEMFVDVTVKVSVVPLSSDSDGPAEGFGNTVKRSLLKASSVWVEVVPGLTEESVANWKLALDDPDHKLRLRMYSLAARKE